MAPDERTHRVFKNALNQDAPTYVVVGTGGNREGHAKGYASPAPEWSAWRNDTHFGHGTVAIHNSTHMLWRWHVNEDGLWEARDEVWIVRHPTVAVTDDSQDQDDISMKDDDEGSNESSKSGLGIVVLIVGLSLCIAATCALSLRKGWITDVGSCPDRLGNAMDELCGRKGASDMRYPGGSMNDALLEDPARPKGF